MTQKSCRGCRFAGKENINKTGILCRLWEEEGAPTTSFVVLKPDTFYCQAFSPEELREADKESTIPPIMRKFV